MSSAHTNTKSIEKNSRLCVGLDPRLEWIPEKIKHEAIKLHGKTFEAAGHAILTFNKQVIDVVAPLVPAIKPQIAFYELYGVAGLTAFAETILYAKHHDLIVIADAKRGDIDSTAQAYANAFLGTTNLFGQEVSTFDADWLTVNPFLGEDSLLPFIETCKKYNKGIFVLVKTSNAGSRDIQDLKIGNTTITSIVSELIAKHAATTIGPDGYSNIGAVVGATFPEEAQTIRKRLPHSLFLVPGMGAQGGDFSGLTHFFNTDKLGGLINSSREIVFSKRAEDNDDYLQTIKEQTINMNKAINKELGI